MQFTRLLHVSLTAKDASGEQRNSVLRYTSCSHYTDFMYRFLCRDFSFWNIVTILYFTLEYLGSNFLELSVEFKWWSDYCGFSVFVLTSFVPYQGKQAWLPFGGMYAWFLCVHFPTALCKTLIKCQVQLFNEDFIHKLFSEGCTCILLGFKMKGDFFTFGY